MGPVTLQEFHPANSFWPMINIRIFVTHAIKRGFILSCAMSSVAQMSAKVSEFVWNGNFKNQLAL